MEDLQRATLVCNSFPGQRGGSPRGAYGFWQYPLLSNDEFSGLGCSHVF